MLWILNQSDGSASLLDIARRSGLSYAAIQQAAQELAGAGLLAADKPVRKRRKSPGLLAKRMGAKKAVSGEKR